MARDFSRIKSLTFPLCYLPLAMPHCHTGVWYFALAAVAPDKSFKFDRGAIVLCCFISENAEDVPPVFRSSVCLSICIITFMGGLHNLGADLAIFIFNRKTSPISNSSEDIVPIHHFWSPKSYAKGAFDYSIRRVCIISTWSVCVRIGPEIC